MSPDWFDVCGPCGRWWMRTRREVRGGRRYRCEQCGQFTTRMKGNDFWPRVMAMADRKAGKEPVNSRLGGLE